MSRELLPLILQQRSTAAAMVVLGLLEALSESIGISLFVPFLYSLDPQAFQPDANEGPGQALVELFAWLPDSDRLTFITLLIFGLILLKGLLSYANQRLFSWFDIRLSQSLCSGVVDQILSVEIRSVENAGSGKLLNLLESETYTTSEAAGTLLEWLIALVTVAVFAVLMMLISWQLTLSVLSALALISLFLRWLTRRVESLSRAGLRADEAFAQRAIELLSRVRTIRTYGQEDHERQRFSTAQNHMNRMNHSLDRISALIEPVSEVLAAGVLLCVLFFATVNSSYLPGVLVFLLILLRLQPQLTVLAAADTALAEASAPIFSVAGFLRRDDKAYIPSGPVSFSGFQDRIQFHGVSYAYEPGDDDALSELSFTIERGETVAIVGPSGAGKSTLVNLIVRLADPTDGTISVDGRALRELQTASWRARLAVVGQLPGLFGATVRENIAYGRPGASEAEIMEAARQAAAHDFICALPLGYDTPIDEHGTRLSSGQQQRLAIARAIVRDPDILVLDEATSTLDGLSERLIHESLVATGPDRTTILVAHRISTIDRADRILVLDSGRLVEQGNSRQLLENDGLYASMYRSQRRESPDTRETG